MTQHGVRAAAEGTGEYLPLAIDRYDRAPDLRAPERAALARLLGQHLTRHHRRQARGELCRLVGPLADALALFGVRSVWRAPATQILLQEMAARTTSYWAWSEAAWHEVVQPDFPAFRRRYPRVGTHESRSQLVGIAYLFGPLTDLSSVLLRSVSPVALAERMFGREPLERAVACLAEVIRSWGYASGQQRQQLQTALAELLLTNRSPRLEDLTDEVLAAVAGRTHGHLRHSLGRISRALAQLGYVARALPTAGAVEPLEARVDTSGVAPAWAEWCLRWYRTADLAPKTRRDYLQVLLRVGRWLARHQPAVTTPHHWTAQVAAEYVAALGEMRVGDFVDAAHTATILPRRFGQPLAARTQDRHLAVLRAFFRDLHEEPHRIPRRFDPARALRTPRAVKHRIAPQPRDLDPVAWAKLVHAAVQLTEEDLPRLGGRASGALRYPLALVRAVAAVWVYSGLRCDEIVRLPVGCIRWQREDVQAAGTAAVVPRDAVCFLTVPTNKTTAAFVKPVNPLVGDRIAAWERVRAASQPALPETKTGGAVTYLFSHRGQRLGMRYLNASLIPTLCRKAGLPPADERGAITSHRARATIATLLYNAPEGLTLWELMQWLGHKDPKSTQHYARVNPTRLAGAYAQAERTSRLVEVLVDTHATADGGVPVYYVLGDHGWCSNPAWASCAYRMACIKCPFFVPQDQGRLIEARESVRRFLEVVELTDEEVTAAEDDHDKLAANVARTRHLPSPRTVQRRAKGASSRGIPLPVLQAGVGPLSAARTEED